MWSLPWWGISRRWGGGIAGGKVGEKSAMMGAAPFHLLCCLGN